MYRRNSRYMRALNGLYGAKGDDSTTIDIFDDIDLVKKKNARSNAPTEFQEHMIVAKWLMTNKIPFYHIPNGGYRKYEEAQKLKAMGVFSGVPDLCILGARNGFHGLYVEVKRSVGGKLSDTQKYWGELLTREGYLFKEGKGAEECIRIIRDYFGI